MHSQQNTSLQPEITLNPSMPIVLTHYDKLLRHPELTPTTELVETISDLNTATHPEATASGGSQQHLLKNPLIERIEAYFTKHTIPLGLLVALKHVFGKNLCIYLDDETTPDRWQHLQRTIKSLVELLSILPYKQISIIRPSTQQKFIIDSKLSLQKIHNHIEALFFLPLRSGYTLASVLNAIHPPETLIYVFTHQSNTLATAITQTKSTITMVDSSETTTRTRHPHHQINSLNQEQKNIASTHHGQIIYNQGIWFIHLLTTASQESPLHHINGQSPWGIGTLSQFYGYEFPATAYQAYLQPFLQKNPDLEHFADILTATFPRTPQTFIEASLESYRRFGTRPATSRPGKPPSPISSLGLLAIPSTASLHAKTTDHATASNQPLSSNRPNSL